MSGNGKKPPPAKWIKCSYPGCGQEFLTIADLQAHIASNHPGSSK